MSNHPEIRGVFGNEVGVESLRDSLLPLWNDSYEICGLVLKDGAIYPVRNVHEELESNFQFSIEDLDKFMDGHKYEEVLGVYHSHPSNNPLPSQKDVLGWPRGGGLRYFIVTRERVTEWKKDHDHATTLVDTAE